MEAVVPSSIPAISKRVLFLVFTMRRKKLNHSERQNEEVKKDGCKGF